LTIKNQPIVVLHALTDSQYKRQCALYTSLQRQYWLSPLLRHSEVISRYCFIITVMFTEKYYSI